MVRLVDHTPWIPVVGEIMVAFGDIEHSINELLRNVCSEADMKAVIKQQLHARIKRLAAALVDWKDLSEANKDVIRLNLGEVEELAKTRNLIAHNPLVFSAFRDADGEPDGRFNIWSERYGNAITLAELTVKAVQATRLSDALHSNWVDYDVAYMRGQQPTLKRPAAD